MSKLQSSSEEWKDICYKGYQISSNGIIRNKNTGRILKTYMRNNGQTHLFIKLRIENKKSHTLSIHRLVANAFIPNPNNLPVVNHIDENPKNNHKDNLIWSTQRDNLLHSRKVTGSGKVISLKMIRKIYTDFPNISIVRFIELIEENAK